MRPVKWDAVKLKAQQAANIGAYNHYDSNGVRMENPACYALLEGVADKSYDWRGKLNELQALIWDRIVRWDIRCIRKLHELFPSCLPRDCKYVVDYNDKGEWVVFE